MWRCLKVGALLPLIMPAVVALAQVSGTVESIGFDNHVRPDCWTPMVISVTPETSKNDYYQIHVKLQDMDRDLPVYERTISVTGASEGQVRQQKFRMYFLPSPTDNGLPDWNDPNALRDLQDKLKVSLHSNSGKWICDLPITTAVRNLDPKPSSGGAYWQHRGSKLIIAVAERSSPIYRDPTTELYGVMEDAYFVQLHARDLPEKVLGYESVDAIVWFDADPADLKAGGDEKFRALQDYVHRGGKLVICQPAEWQKTLGFEDLLPLSKIEGIEEKDDLQPLRGMAVPKSSNQDPQLRSDPFVALKPPYRFARAVAKPNSVVDEWIAWKTADDVSPYVVRMPVGLGSVTWVAQDLGDPALVRSRVGWVNVWDRIFDWKNDPRPVTQNTPDNIKEAYAPGFVRDVGKSLLGGMELSSKSLWMMALAVLFFIGYWVVAGPGTYTWLATRKQTHLSWFMYGLCAFAATALTVGIVKLVLRGPPELRHFSIVKVAPNEPAVVISRFGLYIPRDGMQRIELKDAAPNAVTSISPLPIHPYFLNKAPDETGAEYTIPVVDEASGQTASVSVPYRSTMKKFQAMWVGNVEGAVRGNPKLVPEDMLEGSLINATGRRLRNIYIAFHWPGEGAEGADWMLYVPSWEDGSTLNLKQAFNVPDDSASKTMPFVGDQNHADGSKRVRGRLDPTWSDYWLKARDMGQGAAMDDTFDDSGWSGGVRKSLVIMSFFDRLKPMKNDAGTRREGRLELLRRGGRMLDMSGSIAAGAMVVIAEADGPIPMPLEVEGDRITGDGLTFYQFVIPLDHSAVASTTQPTTQPE